MGTVPFHAAEEIQFWLSTQPVSERGPYAWRRGHGLFYCLFPGAETEQNQKAPRPFKCPWSWHGPTDAWERVRGPSLTCDPCQGLQWLDGANENPCIQCLQKAAEDRSTTCLHIQVPHGLEQGWVAMAGKRTNRQWLWKASIGCFHDSDTLPVLVQQVVVHASLVMSLKLQYQVSFHLLAWQTTRKMWMASTVPCGPPVLLLPNARFHRLPRLPTSVACLPEMNVVQELNYSQSKSLSQLVSSNCCVLVLRQLSWHHCKTIAKSICCNWQTSWRSSLSIGKNLTFMQHKNCGCLRKAVTWYQVQMASLKLQQLKEPSQFLFLMLCLVSPHVVWYSRIVSSLKSLVLTAT